MTTSNSKSAIPRNHNESHRTKTCKTISNTKSTIPRNHNELNHEIREILQRKCLKEKNGYKFMKQKVRKILVK